MGAPDDTEAHTDVEEPTGATTARHKPEEPDSLVRGDDVDRYLVVSLLGRGGMGAVYAAYDPELDRRIALKVIRPHRGRSAEALAEAQALARLSHPNIVSVYDVGTVDGSVFIAMELVEGTTFDAWLEQPHTWQEIVGVLTAIGRGLEAAHAVGLVHRDVKPDNIILGVDGRPRLIDFGVAFHGPQPDRPSQPRGFGPDVLVGTPAFMAPEQFVGGDVGPFTDQFSFAIVLYRALWKRRPFEGAGPEPGPVIAPPDDDVPPVIRAAIMRALALAPGERFASLRELVDAIQPPPKRRSWWPIAAAMLALVVTGVALGVASSSTTAPPECDAFDRELDGIWDAKRRATLAGAFGEAPEWPAVAQILDRYVAEWVRLRTSACDAERTGRLDAELGRQRVACLDGRLRRVDAAVSVLARGGKVIDQAVDVVGALPSLAWCENVAAVFASQPPASIDATTRRSVDDALARANTHVSAGEYGKAREQAGQAAKTAAAVGWPSATARALAVRGYAEHRDGKSAVGRATLFEAIALAMAARDAYAVAEAWTALVGVEVAGMKQPSEALRLAGVAAVAIEQAGSDHELAGVLAQHRGSAMRILERYSEALAEYQDARALFERALGENHPRLAMVRGSIGNVLRNLGKPIEAVGELESVLDLESKLFGNQHPALAGTLNNLALAYDELRRFDDAQRTLVRSLAIKEKQLGKDHPSVAPTLLNLAALDRRRGDFAAADAKWDRAYAVRVAGLGAKHPDVTRTLYSKLLDRTNRGLDAQARELAREVLARFATQQDAVELGSAYGVDCELLRRVGRLNAAADRCKQALATLGGERAEPRRAAIVHAYAARVAVDRGDLETARAALTAAEAALANVKRDAALAGAHVAWARSRVLGLAKRPGEARDAATAALTGFTDEGAGYAYYIGEAERAVQ